MKIKVLLVDDSSFMRVVLSDIVNSSPDITVLDTAVDGKEAVDKTRLLKPDVVLLDLTMKDYDGLYAVKHIMADCPTPIVILSSLGNTNPDAYVEALEAGAYDFLNKPEGIINSKIRNIDQLIFEKIKAASRIDIKNLKLRTTNINNHIHTFDKRLPFHAVVIGSSTGGTGAIEHIIINLPQNFPVPVLVAQHMPAEFVNSFASRLNGLTPLDVKVAEEGEILRGNTVYIMPGYTNTFVKRRGEQKVVFEFTDKSYPEFNHPSVDCLMTSAAEVYGKNLIALILTGMGKDGTEGMKAIYGKGGYTIAQDEKSSVVWGMPKSAYEAGIVKQVLPLNDMPHFIVSALS